MQLRCYLAVVFLAAAAFALFAGQPFAAEVKAQAEAEIVPQTGSGNDVLRIAGDANEVELDVHQARLADVLSALGRFNIRVRSPVALNEVIDGTYAGPLNRVLSRLLAGYNYAIKKGDTKIDVIIVSLHGEQAIPAPIIVQRRGSGE
jgi:hypothetical protein